MVICAKIWSLLFSGRHEPIQLAIFPQLKKTFENLDMHFEEDSISICLPKIIGSVKDKGFSWVIKLRFRFFPVKYNYPRRSRSRYRSHLVYPGLYPWSDLVPIYLIVRLVADDLTLYLTIEGEEDSAMLQQDLDKLSTCELDWDMEFNPRSVRWCK